MSTAISKSAYPEDIGAIVAEEFAAGCQYVHLTELPFGRMGAETQAAYIREVSSVLGQLSLSNEEPDSDLWRLDARLSPNARRIPFHTDNPFYTYPEIVVGFWNVKSSAEGGENVLLPAKELLDAGISSSPEAAELMFQACNTPMRFSRDDHAAEAPIIDDSGEDVLIRYAHDALNSSAPEHHALRAKFSAFLESSVAQTGATAIKLTEGDVLFFDNRRLLHAREPYSDPNRLNIRVRISDPRSVA